jgi:hypothetical protein
MIYFTASASHPEYTVSGNYAADDLAKTVNYGYEAIVKVQADGYDLERCCAILGRQRPDNHKIYTFVGDNAKEIAANW